MNRSAHHLARRTGALLALLSLGLAIGSAPTSTIAQAAKKLSCKNCITGKHVRNGSLTGLDIRNNTLTTSDVRNNSLTGADVRNGTLTGADIANNSITGVDIRNGSVTAPDLAAGAVGAPALASGAVTSSRIANGAVTRSKLGSRAVDASKLASELLSNGLTTITVDCGAGDSVQDAIDAASGVGVLEITIDGACAENVWIARDNVTLKGGTNGKLVGVAPPGAIDVTRTRVITPGLDLSTLISVVNVNGASGVIVAALEIEGISGGNHGVFVFDNGSVTVQQDSVIRNHDKMGIFLAESSNVDVFYSTVEDNGWDGVAAIQNSHADTTGATIQNNGGNGVLGITGSTIGLRDTTVAGNGANGVLLESGATGDISGSTTVESDAISRSAGAAVALFGNATLEVANGATIANTSNNFSTSGDPDAAGGFALRVWDGSVARLVSGSVTLTGNTEVYNLSSVRLAEAAITGNLYSLGLFSSIELKGPSSNGTTVDGSLYPASRGFIDIETGGDVQITGDGDIDCTNGSAADVTAGFTNFDTGGYQNCT